MATPREKIKADQYPTAEIMEIVLYGHPALRVRSAEVTEFDDELKRFVDNLFATMLVNEGVGLAAPQVNRPIRVLVVGVPIDGDHDNLLRLDVVNPEILQYDGSWEYEEGCLSIPDVRDKVTRPEKIKIKYQDLEGKEHILEAEGLLARVLQHEIDHINGILFIDHLSPVRRALHAGKLKRLARESD